MSEPLSLSIFTIEADRKPALTFTAKKQTDAEAFLEMKWCAPNFEWPIRVASPSATSRPLWSFV